MDSTKSSASKDVLRVAYKVGRIVNRLRWCVEVALITCDPMICQRVGRLLGRLKRSARDVVDVADREDVTEAFRLAAGQFQAILVSEEFCEARTQAANDLYNLPTDESWTRQAKSDMYDMLLSFGQPAIRPLGLLRQKVCPAALTALRLGEVVDRAARPQNAHLHVLSRERRVSLPPADAGCPQMPAFPTQTASPDDPEQVFDAFRYRLPRHGELEPPPDWLAMVRQILSELLRLDTSILPPALPSMRTGQSQAAWVSAVDAEIQTALGQVRRPNAISILTSKFKHTTGRDNAIFMLRVLRKAERPGPVLRRTTVWVANAIAKALPDFTPSQLDDAVNLLHQAHLIDTKASRGGGHLLTEAGRAESDKHGPWKHELPE